nr:hypothetical protein [Tanacetum cinerariifolium]
MESDEFIKSSVENLVPILCESEDFSDMKVNVICPIVMILKRQNFQRFPIFSSTILPLVMTSQVMRSEFNPIHNEDLASTPKNDHFDTKSYLLESLLNRDTLMASSPKFDSFLEEFFGELAHTDLIPQRINEANCDPEEDIHLVERLLDPFMKEIDLFLASDGSIPSGIDSDDSDSEGDNLFLERLLHDDLISLSDILDFSNVVRVFLPFFTYPVTSSILLSFEKNSSGSTTTPPDISLPEYKAFYDDHVKEISSGSPTTHSDSSLYASFIFDLSINPFPPADRSYSYEFTDELIPFI